MNHRHMQETFERCQNIRAILEKMGEGPYNKNPKLIKFREEILEQVKQIEDRTRL